MAVLSATLHRVFFGILKTEARAVTIRQGKCELHEPLPENQDERTALLESLSR